MSHHPVLVASKSFGYGAPLEKLNSLFSAYSLKPTFEPFESALAHIDEFEGIIIGTSKVTREVLFDARNLKAVVKYGVGIDNIDTEAARELNVKVFNLPGINSESVAEMALSLMFAAGRKVAMGDRSLRAGKWEGLIGNSLTGKTLGIIGTGSIGCSLARMVAGLNMTVIGYDIVENEDFPRAGGSYVPLEELLASADYISLHLSLNPKTQHFIDREKMALMKSSAILINTSRGKVVDERALIEALNHGKLAGAGLDVFEEEPPTCPELLAAENAVITPHIAAYTHETLRRMDEACVSTMSRALLGALS
jgi:D-3-phosphoglycerate dehydrogenase